MATASSQPATPPPRAVAQSSQHRYQSPPTISTPSGFRNHRYDSVKTPDEELQHQQPTSAPAINTRAASNFNNAPSGVLRSPTTSTAGGQHSSLSHHSSNAHSSPSSHQPISLAEVLDQAGGDVTRALDEVLAERNKFCLEAAKLSSENVRIWNLMGRIRKENETFKARLQQQQQAPQAPSATLDRLATPPPIPQRRITNPDVARSLTEDPSLTSFPSSPHLSGSSISNASNNKPAHRNPGTSSPLTTSASLPGLSREQQQHHNNAGRSSTMSANTSASDRTSASQDHAQSSQGGSSQGHQHSVAQQRVAARALQQEQQRKASTNNRIPSARDHHPRTDSPPRPSAEDGRARRNSVGSHEDYEAMDDSAIGTEAAPASSAVKAQDGPASVAHVSDNNLQRNRSRTITAARAAAAARRTEQEELTQQLSPGDEDGDFSPFDSIGNSSQASAVMMETPPRVRRKDFGAMGLPTSSSSSGLQGSNNAIPRLRHSPSSLKPRQAITRNEEANDEEGSASNAAQSLTQALIAAAIEGPPNEPNYAPQPHLTNQLLKQTHVAVSGSNLHYNEKGREVISFFLLVELTQGGRTPETGLSKWKIEKLYSDVLALDARIKHKHGKAAIKKMAGANVQLPDKGLFKDHAPSKVDMRKYVLEAYLANLLAITLPDKDELCTFLCTDVVPIRSRDPKSMSKEGFLTKKGQNLGRWVTRFYCLDNNRLQHYEGRGGSLLGTINLRGAQIGRQQRSPASDMDENSYRHAFLILERRSEGSTQQQQDGGGAEQLVRHVLCAESDEERDDWVDVLVRCIGDMERKEKRAALATSASRPNLKAQNSFNSRDPAIDAMGASDTAAAPPTQPSSISSAPSSSPHSRALKLAGVKPDVGNATQGGQAPPTKSSGAASASSNAPASGSAPKPKRSGSLGRKLRSRDGSSNAHSSSVGASGDDYSNDLTVGTENSRGSPVPAVLPSQARDRASIRPSISGPLNGAPIPSGYKFGARDESAVSASGNATAGDLQRRDDKRRFWHRFGGGAAEKSDSRAEVRPVFGISLTDAIAISSVSDGLALPSVVYRCIEFLEKKQAVKEEGIYRLSGSTAEVKALRERFNTEGDVDLLQEEVNAGSLDPHAVAGLLKAYLRELPTSVLTRDLHMEFMRVLDILDKKERSRELGQLVSSLPLANYTLLRTLCKHLIKVISYQDVNKMTMRNVGIVFSPTLGIPAGLFSEFLTSFDYCFDTGATHDDEVTVTSPPQSLTQTAPAQEGVRGEALSSSPHEGAPASRRSNRNSLYYPEEEASKIMDAPSGHHRIVSAHPDRDPVHEGTGGGGTGGYESYENEEGEGQSEDADLDLLRVTEDELNGEDSRFETF